MRVMIELTEDEVKEALALYLIERRGVPMSLEEVRRRVRIAVTRDGVEGRLAAETSERFCEGPYR